jgi:hypothetical protein
MPKGYKIDPSGITDAEFYAWRAKLAPVEVPAAPGPRQYNAESSFIGAAPPYDPAWAVTKIITNNPYCQYNSADVRAIVNLYVTYATQAGLDWWLVLCQNMHETGRLSSWWSARPRRNPAGIGVNGRISTVKPAEAGWEYHEIDKVWKKGLTFISWRQAVQVHVGHLLCYVYTDEEMSPEQLRMSAVSPNKPFIPSSYRGSTKQISGLTQRWAYSKVLPPVERQYHNRICAMANTI